MSKKSSSSAKSRGSLGAKGHKKTKPLNSSTQRSSKPTSSHAGRSVSTSRSVSKTQSRGGGESATVARIGFIAVVLALVIFGLVMLYSASSIYSYNLYGDYTEVFTKQLTFVAIGILLVLIMSFIPYRASIIFPACIVAFAVTIPLLLWVLIEGNDALGARRWIDLGFTSIQPSEFSKIFMMLVLAHLVDRCRSEGYTLALIIVMVVSCAVPLGLIIIEPDLGTTIIAFVGILAVLWLGGVPKRVVALLGAVVLVLGILAIVGTGFRQARITSWLDPASDPLGDGYQLLNSYYAFGGGGIFGVGLGMSKQKFSWLPQSENDFIYAIVGEELGLIGALAVVILFMALVYFALKVARSAPDALGAMIAGSSGIIIGAQAFLNIMCVIGVLPTTGKPLPFFSAGGSSFITTMLLVGLVLSVSMQSNEATVYDFRREEFTVVEGGRNRGASLGGRDSVLSRLPNPAAIIAGGIRPRPVAQETRPVRRRTSNDEKIVPISRARAEKSARDANALRKKREGYHNERPMAGSSTNASAPVSMSSLRRNRVRKVGGGGRSA